MDGLLARHGLENTENLDVPAFELGADREPRLPDLHVSPDVRTWIIENDVDLRRAYAMEAAIFPTSTP
jgi:hypothetical protein